MLSCPSCFEKLPMPELHNTEIVCRSCDSILTKKNGVWDFRLSQKSYSLAIFQEPEYLRWLDIFGKQEISNWKIYETRLNRFFSQAGHRILAKKLISEIDELEWVVEVGAGDGLLYRYAPRKNYIGIDTNWDALVNFSRKNPNVMLICTSGGYLPIQSESIEALVSLHTLEHIYYLGEFMEEVIRVLKRGGRQYFVIPTEGGLPFYLGRKFITGPNAKKKYNLDSNYIMDREHINDAKRVLKFLRLYFPNMEKRFWPLPFFRSINMNVMIWGSCRKTAKI